MPTRSADRPTPGTRRDERPLDEPHGYQSGRETRVLDAVEALVDRMLLDFDVVELLTTLTEHCASLLDVASVGLLLADPRHQLHLMAATSARTEELEVFQLQAEEGPCLDCYTTGQPISVASMELAALRWPHFVPAAMNAGFTSVHVLPLRAAGTVLGAMGLFGTEQGQLAAADLQVGQTLAHIACVAILRGDSPNAANVFSPLRIALGSRVVVEQASGFLHESLDITVDAAFSLLRHYAETYDQRMTDVAKLLLGTSDARPAILAAMKLLQSPRHPIPEVD